MQWELLTPPEFDRLAREEQVCVVPIGCLERHGEHMPFGTDSLIAHKIAVEAAKKEPCVVFPPYHFAQIHEARCYSGAIALPQRMALELLECICDEIARNGFKKIVLFNGHGGNSSFLDYFLKSNLGREVDYTLYLIPMYSSGLSEEETEKIKEICGKNGDHAGEWEGSLVMAAAPGSVKMEQHTYAEPIQPQGRLKHLGRVRTLREWNANYPYNTTGCPSKATQAQGEAMLEIYIDAFVRDLKAIKADTETAKLQSEFYEGMKR